MTSNASSTQSPGRHTDEPAPSWAVAPVAVPVGADGAQVVVDVADPTRPLPGWQPDGQPPAPDALTTAQARYALTLGVQRWSTQPLDERIVGIDVGIAAGDAGDPHTAAALLRRYAGTVLHLGEEILTGQAPAPLTVAVARAVGDTVNALPPDHPLMAELGEIHERLNGPDFVNESDIDWDNAIADLVRTDQELALSAAAGGHRVSAGIHRRLVDTRLLPARIVAFTRNYDGVAVTVTGEASHLVASLPVLPGIDEDTPGIDEVLARAVEGASGTQVAIAPASFHPASRPGTPARLIALLDLGGHSAGNVEIDFFHAGNTLESRYGPTRDALLRIDGNAVHGWSLSRMSAAARVFPTTGEPLGGTWAVSAGNAVRKAISLAGQISKTAEAARRRPRLQQLSRTLWTPGPASGPLMSELWHLYTSGP